MDRITFPKIIFTKHAKQRAYEFQLDLNQAKQLLLHSQFEKNKFIDVKRIAKYGDKTGTIYRNGTYLFTVVETKDKFTGDNIALVITLFDQRLNLR